MHYDAMTNVTMKIIQRRADLEHERQATVALDEAGLKACARMVRR